MKKSFVRLVVVLILTMMWMIGCGNEPPVIESLAPEPLEDTLVAPGDTIYVVCTADDPDYKSRGTIPDVDEDPALDYSWEVPDGGQFFDIGDPGMPDSEKRWRYWESPTELGDYRIICMVTDQKDATDSDTLTITVQESQ